MSLYNQEYNKDTIVLRYIIVATLAELKSQLYYYNLVNDEGVKVEIPFYYSTTGEERFLQDNFVYDTVEQGKAIGDYETVPRGVLQMQGFSINTDELTNKYSKANYTVMGSDGIVRTVVADTNFIPITMNFDVTIVLTNTLEILKVSEVLVSKLYKSQIFYVDLGMCTMQSSITIPEDFSEEKPFEFQVDTKKEYQITFSIEVKSFLPVLPKGLTLNQLRWMVEDFINMHPDNTDILSLRTDSASADGLYDNTGSNNKDGKDRYFTDFNGFAICANGIIEKFYENTNYATNISNEEKMISGNTEPEKVTFTETTVIEEGNKYIK